MAYKYSGDLKKYEACLVAEERSGHYQFSYEYQNALDRALEIDPDFAPAYKYKSTAYLKSGDFTGWKKLMDKAVELDPVSHLDYRGWCRFQFFRDYAGAIADIERLAALLDGDLGYSQNGYYHLEIARALCYKGLGDSEKAISIIENKLSESGYSPGPYDYIHLGVLYLEKGQFRQAKKAFLNQEKINDLAENRYYFALTAIELGDLEKAKENLELAREKYAKGFKMFDPYTDQMDKIYLESIEHAASALLSLEK
ncbi:hypothetical protein [Algoriphagus namhaensis]